MARFASYVAVAALLVGCGPSLDQVARTTQGFAVKERCAQGPFELHVPAFGSKWGEDVTLEARGNGVEGHSSIIIEGGERHESSFAGVGVDANACVLSEQDRAAVVTGGAPVQMPTANTTTATSASTSTSTRAAVTLVPAGVPSSWIQRTEIAKYHYEVNDWGAAKGVLKKGQDMKIVFWSEHPLDLAATTFVLTHSEMVAPKNWEAHLDEVKADAEKAQREAEAKARETQGERVAYAELQSRCEELARRNATDKTCRDDGWRNENERPETTHVTNLALQAPVEPKPQGRSADRPPPAPQAETQSPKPSEHAEWIPGSWQWSGFDWVWLAGGWRVPEQDRAQHLTATAPSAPPPMRVEAHPPQPIASAVWAEGYWHWSSGQWIWVPGHWAVPPRAGATWRPSTWIPEGVQLRLDPGGWTLR